MRLSKFEVEKWSEGRVLRLTSLFGAVAVTQSVIILWGKDRRRSSGRRSWGIYCRGVNVGCWNVGIYDNMEMQLVKKKQTMRISSQISFPAGGGDGLCGKATRLASFSHQRCPTTAEYRKFHT